MHAMRHRLGDILVAQSAISRETLEAHAPKAQGRLGEYLRAHGHISGQALARALALQHNLIYVNLTKAQADRTLFRPHAMAHYQTHRYIPYLREKSTLVVATPEPSESLRVALAAHYAQPILLVIISARDFTRYFTATASVASTRHAQLALRRKHRHLVADRIFLRHQWFGFLVVVTAAATALALAPHTSWHALLIGCNLFYLVTLAIKLTLYREGVAALKAQRKPHALRQLLIAQWRDADLPIYTLLVPLYHESWRVITRLLHHLEALDYPKEKLDIKFICEADDTETIETLIQLRPPETVSIVRVPPSHPRTKPKACNVALQQIRGEYVAIFDAEDAPARDQLKQAVAMFRTGGADLACVQGRLNYDNRDENLLTQLFAIEYSALFRLLLPALERMKLPIPLGGTSNHLRASALRDVGGWDAFNVTEDADLGIRLAYFGYRTGMLPSLTLEEAPITLPAWMRQRTRWIKGYIQTWLVYTRHPRELKRRLGVAGYYGFQFFIGAPALTFLLAPIFWAVFFVSICGLLPAPVPPLLLVMCIVAMAGGFISNWLFARAVMEIEGWHQMRLAISLYPFYWLLHSIAAIRAIGQLLYAPHHWGKTQHGVSRKMSRLPRVNITFPLGHC